MNLIVFLGDMLHRTRTTADRVVTVVCLILFIAWLIYDRIRNYKNKRK